MPIKQWHAWTPHEDTKLLDLIKGRQRLSTAEWEAVGKNFPDRSIHAIRNRYSYLRAIATGNLTPRRSGRAVNARHIRHNAEDIALRANPIDLPYPASITAFVFGDPLPGRSALDKKMQGATA